ncbi:MAG: GDP-mannose 4,6-dehydratase [Candidatus Omnitrophica bacterium]|nr:GDP-mannose 4,6-dehydratase [Candidatus Omnitrophota bacterium]
MNTRFWKGKRVLVTGHEGFLGSNLVRTLVNAGARVVGVDKVAGRPLSVLNGVRGLFKGIKQDLSDYQAVRLIIAARRPAVVFHLAAEAIVGRAKKEPLRVFRSNIEGTWNILESCRGKKFVKSIVVASSDKAYGTALNLPYNEDTPLKGRQTYDASKSCEDIIARSFFYSYGLPVAVMRCGNIYGPGDFNFSRLIPDAVRSALAGKRFVIRSDGKYTRDYVFIDDVVEGYLALAEKMAARRLYGAAFNLSDEKPQTVLQVYRAVGKAFGGNIKKPVILNRALDEIRDQYLSAKKIRRVLGWKARYTFAEGLRKTVAWYREEL